MRDFNLKKYLLENRLTKNKKKINEAFEGFGGVRGIAPIQEAPIGSKDPWGWEDSKETMKGEDESNAWIADIDRFPAYKGWTASWEHPGIIVWSHPDISDLSVVATPGWDGPGTPIELQFSDGESKMVTVLDQDTFPNFQSYVKVIGPYLDSVANEYSESNMNEIHSDLSQDGMGLPIKPVIHPDDMEEDFDPRQLSSSERMDGLVNQRELAKFAEAAMAIAQDLDDDGFDASDIKRFLIAKLDDMILV